MLLDVNVLVALAWPNHVHHRPARTWFSEHCREGWSTCPLTESGFVRVSANRHAVEHAVTPAEAIDLLRRLREHGRHSFLSDGVSLIDSEHVHRDALVAHRQVTDAHLLALAIDHGARLVTFDGKLRQLVPAGRDPSDFLVELRSA